ncbi:glycosyltransferase family 4 protein [Prochlorococcus marinus]|uniref:Glycosyl transferase n=1 Tax=Prochlorococcus marinus XMU1408 TaxID=2213228 RepID=A0A318R1M4_PROMR|nr:glycosyltransferase family 4 protein [Prochlorococcus marinus]MBW3042875.1 glycosyl transferase [Prochlorococcus marinus str. XMU1408]PYE00701.1 glycosyl transferase [Prochlorococcus marinus XMU1408]
MKILFIHQWFPGQFRHLAPFLLSKGHTLFAMSMNPSLGNKWQGIEIIQYKAERFSTPNIHPWVTDFETKIIRGEACFRKAIVMRKEGFYPDLIIAHHGWGESLFLKEVWPKAKLGIYCEFFYLNNGADTDFDPEFPVLDVGNVCRLRLKNLQHLLQFEDADAGISPTHWQASTFPESFRSKISVIHDGIDTQKVIPNKNVQMTINQNHVLTKNDEVITFVNRNLEPYRGYHIFMRSLPELLKRRPKARILIVGGDDVSYGTRPENGETWKNIFAAEVRPHIDSVDWGRVHFLGNIEYKKFLPLLQLSTVHIYLTYPFVLSWSLIEAMSCGCAIVASDTKPLHEVIANNQTGKLVNFFDIENLVNQVCHLLDSPEDRERLGNNARDYAKENYDLKNICLPKQIEWVERLLN